MSLTAAEAVELKQAMIKAASQAMEKRPDSSSMARMIREADDDEFDVIIRLTLDDEALQGDPILTGLCKYLRYADENGGLSPGDCLDVQITIQTIAPWIPRRTSYLFDQLKALMESSIEKRSPVEFSGKR